MYESTSRFRQRFRMSELPRCATVNEQAHLSSLAFVAHCDAPSVFRLPHFYADKVGKLLQPMILSSTLDHRYLIEGLWGQSE